MSVDVAHDIQSDVHFNKRKLQRIRTNFPSSGSCSLFGELENPREKLLSLRMIFHMASGDGSSGCPSPLPGISMVFYSQDCVPFYLVYETLPASNVLHILSVLDTSNPLLQLHWCVPFWSNSLTRGASLAPGLAFSRFWFVLWQLSKLKLCCIGLGL